MTDSPPLTKLTHVAHMEYNTSRTSPLTPEQIIKEKDAEIAAIKTHIHCQEQYYTEWYEKYEQMVTRYEERILQAVEQHHAELKLENETLKHTLECKNTEIISLRNHIIKLERNSL